MEQLEPDGWRDAASTLASVLEDLLADGRAELARERFERATALYPLGGVGTIEPALRMGTTGFAQTVGRSWRAAPRPLLPWYDLVSFDGFRRHAAIRELDGEALDGGAPNAFALLLLVRRLNDWVPQVRAVARNVVPRAFDASSFEDRYAVLSHVLARLTDWGRLGDAERAVVDELVRRPQFAREVCSRAESVTAGPIKRILQASARSRLIDTSFDRLSRDAVMPSIRAFATQALLTGRVEWPVGWERRWIDRYAGDYRLVPRIESRDITIEPDCLVVLRRAARDESAAVRRVASEVLAARRRTLDEAALAVARQLTGDSWPSIAHRARFAIERRNDPI